MWLLCRVNHMSEDSVLGRTFPSWIPQWDNGSEHYHLASKYHSYQAGKSDEAFKPILKVDRILSFSALHFDQVAWTSDIINWVDYQLKSAESSHTAQSPSKPVIDILWDDLLKQVNMRNELEVEFTLTLILHDHNHWQTLPASIYQRDFEAYRYLARAASDPGYKIRSTVPFDFDIANPHTFSERARHCHHRRLIATTGGRLGIASEFSRVGDICCVSPGLPYPILIRSRNDGTYNFVGDMYVYGVMEGQIIDEYKQGKRTLETTMLV
jgi:hypothetical protein